MLVFYENCLQTISLPDGKVLTEAMTHLSALTTSDWPYKWLAMKHLVTPDSIFYAMNGSNEPVSMMDIAKGNPRQMIVDKKIFPDTQFIGGRCAHGRSTSCL